MAGIFRNQSKQLRSGWRIARVLLLAGFSFVFSSLVIGSVAGHNGISKFLLPLSMVAAVLISLLLFEKRGTGTIGLAFTGSKLMVSLFSGIVLSLLSCVAIYLGLSFTQTLPNGSVPVWSMLLDTGIMGFLYWVVIGLGEEMLFRGYIIRSLPERYGFWLRNSVSVVLFSAIHIVNASYISPVLFLYAFAMGILFGCMLQMTGTIWMSIGYHIVWNYLQTVLQIPDGGTMVLFLTGIVLFGNFVLLYLIRNQLLVRSVPFR